MIGIYATRCVITRQVPIEDVSISSQMLDPIVWGFERFVEIGKLAIYWDLYVLEPCLRYVEDVTVLS